MQNKFLHLLSSGISINTYSYTTISDILTVRACLLNLFEAVMLHMCHGRHYCFEYCYRSHKEINKIIQTNPNEMERASNHAKCKVLALSVWCFVVQCKLRVICTVSIIEVRENWCIIYANRSQYKIKLHVLRLSQDIRVSYIALNYVIIWKTRTANPL